MRTLAALAAALVVTACTVPLPMADHSAEMEGKQFLPPPPGRAALYVFHGNSQYIEISAGQRLLGQLSKGTWLRADLPAGTYDVRCRLMAYTSSNDSLRLTLSPGQLVFVGVTFVALGEPPCRLAVEPEAKARQYIGSGARIREVSGSSD